MLEQGLIIVKPRSSAHLQSLMSVYSSAQEVGRSEFNPN